MRQQHRIENLQRQANARYSIDTQRCIEHFRDARSRVFRGDQLLAVRPAYAPSRAVEQLASVSLCERYSSLLV
jgi:hypothetical protein